MSIEAAYRRIRKPVGAADRSRQLLGYDLPTYPGQVAATAANKYVMGTLDAASRFWDKKSLPRQGGNPTTVVFADTLKDSDNGDPSARGGGVALGYNDNRIYLKNSYMDLIRGDLRSRNPSVRRNAFKRLYALMAHEEGHVRGLHHVSEDPGVNVMSEHGASLMPGDWRAVAKEVIGSRYFSRPRRWTQAPDGTWVRKKRARRKR